LAAPLREVFAQGTLWLANQKHHNDDDEQEPADTAADIKRTGKNWIEKKMHNLFFTFDGNSFAVISIVKLRVPRRYCYGV